MPTPAPAPPGNRLREASRQPTVPMAVGKLHSSPPSPLAEGSHRCSLESFCFCKVPDGGSSGAGFEGCWVSEANIFSDPPETPDIDWRSPAVAWPQTSSSEEMHSPSQEGVYKHITVYRRDGQCRASSAPSHMHTTHSCPYTCMHMHPYILTLGTHTCAHAHSHIHTAAALTHIHVLTYPCTHEYAHVLTLIDMNSHILVHTRMHTFMCIHMHSYTHTFTHTFTHMPTQMLFSTHLLACSLMALPTRTHARSRAGTVRALRQAVWLGQMRLAMLEVVS